MKRNNVAPCLCEIYRQFLDILDIFNCDSSNNQRIVRGKINMSVDEKFTLQHSEDINKLNLSNYPQLTVSNPL
jgi:hypothetical protein